MKQAMYALSKFFVAKLLFHVSTQSMLRRKLSFKELSQYFHLPIDAASKEMSICPTVLKKICRHHGLPRWPHRKVFLLLVHILESEQHVVHCPSSDP